MNTKKIFVVVSMLVVFGRAWADVDLPTKFSNQGSIGNTRHNMTQRQASGGGPSGIIMDQYRNDYQEVCVYCHTPHGANTTATLPLWNRTLKTTSYATYDLLRTSTLTQTVSQPGAASLSCLSCHDGQTAVDSIINMPGSGKYNPNATRDTVQSMAFLNSWGPNASGVGPAVHLALDGVNPSLGCLACHASAAGFVGAGAADFTVLALGTDLKNDHPVGVTFPALSAATEGFKKPGGTKGTASFFDVDGNNNMGKGEVRVYDGKVECASCHDPHGVQSGGANSKFQPTFLRVDNTGSALCLTCHNK